MYNIFYIFNKELLLIELYYIYIEFYCTFYLNNIHLLVHFFHCINLIFCPLK